MIISRYNEPNIILICVRGSQTFHRSGLFFWKFEILESPVVTVDLFILFLICIVIKINTVFYKILLFFFFFHTDFVNTLNYTI